MGVGGRTGAREEIGPSVEDSDDLAGAGRWSTM